MSLTLAIAGLLLPVVLGAIVARARLFADADAAIDALNTFALYVAFPALILVGLARPGNALPEGIGSWFVVPLAFAFALVPIKLSGDLLQRSSGTMALMVAFGNVAYLGLPIVQAVLGTGAMASASLLVSMHVLIALVIGPVLLLAWSGDGSGEAAWREGLAKAVRQPLTWAPLVGLAVRGLPDGLREGIVAVLDPVGRAAPPTALFILGLYLVSNLGQLARFDRVLLAHLATKLLVLPLATLLALAVLDPLGVSRETAAVALLLASMPPAITTFAIARAQGVGTARVAESIVAGSLGALATVPFWGWWAQRLLTP